MSFLWHRTSPGWLAKPGLGGPGLDVLVPLFVSDRRLRGYRRLPRAAVAGRWTPAGSPSWPRTATWQQGPTPAQYVARVRRYRDEIGRLVWAAPQDWMCEPFILAKTGLTVAEHQRRTVDNYAAAARPGPGPAVSSPVVQGWTDRTTTCAASTSTPAAGVDLSRAPLVGVGSRSAAGKAPTTAGRILAALHSRGVTRLHGFGFKISGLRRYGAPAGLRRLAGLVLRRPPPARRCPAASATCNCANCPRYAYRWHRTHIAGIAATGAGQPALFPLITAGAAA